MSKPILYTSHCFRCNIIMRELSNINIDYEICDNINIIKEIGLTTVPILNIEDKYMDFQESL